MKRGNKIQKGSVRLGCLRESRTGNTFTFEYANSEKVWFKSSYSPLIKQQLKAEIRNEDTPKFYILQLSQRKKKNELEGN